MTAHDMPFEDGSFDTVVTTLVLCAVPDPIAALKEVARVLKPGGQMLFLEHVRSSDRRLAWWQDRLAKIWSCLADGCQCNRNTLATLSASGLVVENVEHIRLRELGILVAPAIYGVARRPA